MKPISFICFSILSMIIFSGCTKNVHQEENLLEQLFSGKIKIRCFPVHGIVNGSGKFHLENVANLDQVPATGSYLIVAPIKLEGGSGGQVRLFSVVP